jgi:hypothetical protein
MWLEVSCLADKWTRTQYNIETYNNKLPNETLIVL